MNAVVTKRIAWSFIGLTIAMILFASVIILTAGVNFTGSPGTDISWEDAYAFIAPLTVTVYLVLAGLILSRYPFHVIGWLFLMVSFFISGQLIGLAFELRDLFSGTIAARVVQVLTGDLWVPSFIIPLTLVLQFFPDGRLPSRRWWPVTAAAGFSILLMYAGYVIHPWPWPENNINECCNPLAVSWDEAFFEVLDSLTSLLLTVGVIGSLVSVVARYRRSKGIERVQMKWLVFIAGIFVGITILAGFSGMMDTDAYGTFFLSTPVFMAIAIGIAIVRHRLFDIDLIIRRTLQYAILTGVLGMLYYGGIIFLQNLVGGMSSRDNSTFSIVIVTLGLAALFNPLRTRIQGLIDRRFFRAKYDAEKALADLAATTRNEVDIEALSARLLMVVGETMQPEALSLLLKSQDK